MSENDRFPNKIKYCRPYWFESSEKPVQKVGVSNKAITGFPDALDGVTATPAPTDGDLLLPTPLAGVLVGYGRVSTREQNLARQQAALTIRQAFDIDHERFASGRDQYVIWPKIAVRTSRVR